MNHLLQLLSENRRDAKASQTRIVAAAEETQIYLYDPIVRDRMTAEYFGCVCAQDLVPQIDEIATASIRLRINCPGGDVFAMQAIMNALRKQNARIVGQVDGVAASAATGIAAVCDELVMEPGSLFMIHNSHGLGYGNKNDLLALAELMEKVDVGMLDAYAAKSGKERDQIKAWMDAETWFTAEQTVDAGFADSVSAGRGVNAAAQWKLSAFANAPAPAVHEQKQTPSAEPEPAMATTEHRARQQQRLSMLTRLSHQ